MRNVKSKNRIFFIFVYILVVFSFSAFFVLSAITSENVYSKIFQSSYKQGFEDRVEKDLAKNVNYFDLLEKNGIQVYNNKKYKIFYSNYYYFYSYSQDMFLPTKTHSEFNSAFVSSNINLDPCTGDIEVPYNNRTVAEQTLSSMGITSSRADELFKDRVILNASCNEDGTLGNWRLYLYCRYMNNGKGYKEKSTSGFVKSYECYECTSGTTKDVCNYKTRTYYECRNGVWVPTGTNSYSCSGCKSKTCTTKWKTVPDCKKIYGPEGRVVNEVCTDKEVPDGEECSC
ncbi:MAG: hypothetical protein PHT94_03055 [Candidatus Nanoarchaeia archaeon]|nr:hypothetical protein [Candidatus Nanoarchaeia archaeon]